MAVAYKERTAADRKQPDGEGFCAWSAARRVARGALLIGIGLTVANCSSPVATKGRFGNKYGVAASPKVIPDGEPIPKGGGREMIGKPYVVGERTYVPREGRGYVRDGEASWYGTAFHGRLTANGEIFDKESIAAAHPTLPLPSYVRVTNLANHRSMIVRVNDRGPYERGRLIDVSERAAEALEFRRAGTTKVRVEYVGRASLKGSDDRKLLATLRTGDGPAGFGRSPSPTMLASLDEGAGKPSSAPLAFKLAENRPRPEPLEDGELDEAPRPLPLARPVHDIGPAPHLDETRPVTAAAMPKSDRLVAPGIGMPPPRPQPIRLAEASRLDRSLDLATIPGAARPGAPASHRAAAAASGAKSELLLPPERPVLAGLYYAEPSRKGAGKADPFVKLDRRRVVSLKNGSEPETRLR